MEKFKHMDWESIVEEYVVDQCECEEEFEAEMQRLPLLEHLAKQVSLDHG